MPELVRGLPNFSTPDTLGEIYEYYPTLTELRVAAGVFAIGFLVFTLMLKVAVPVVLGELRVDRERSDPGSGQITPVTEFRKASPA